MTDWPWAVRISALFGIVAFSASLDAQVFGIITNSLPGGTAGISYSQTIVATGGTGEYFWGYTGTLPPGLSLDSYSGLVSGIPTQPGTYNFTATVTDYGNQSVPSVDKTLSIVIAKNVVITTASPLPAALLNAAYNLTFAASSVTTPISLTWSQTGGTLPSGLTLDSAGGLVGTPTQTGTFSFTVTASTFVNDVEIADQKTFSLTVVPPVSITTTILPDATQAIGYSQTVGVTGGTGSYSWSISVGSLPAGLTLSGGVISGVPSQIGTFNFTVRASDTVVSSQSSQSLSIVVGKNLQIITSTALPNGVSGTPYSSTLTASGGSGTYTWSLTVGSLPPGLSLTSAGVVTGTPTQTGFFSFDATVGSTQNSVSLTDQKSFYLTIDPPPLSITTTSLPAGTQAVPYSQRLTASGGSGNPSWSISSGSLPPGITLTGDTLEGVPTEIGTFNFTVSVSEPVIPSDGVPRPRVPGDAARNSRRPRLLAPVSRALSIVINRNLRITTPSLPVGRLRSPYTASLAATGGTQPYQWSLISGALPPGVALSPAGVLSGTPTGLGSFGFVVGVTSVQNDVELSDQRSLAIDVNISPLQVTTTALPAPVPGTPYSASLAATGGTPPYTWTLLAGSLPAGLKLDQAGVISGTPTAEGTSTFAVLVQDDDSQSDSRSFTLAVAYPPLTLAGTLPDGMVNVHYSGVIQAGGGSGKYTFSLASGPLPAGLTLESNGTLSGTPTTAGNYTFQIQVSDTATTKSASGTYSVAIKPESLGVTPSSLPAGVVGEPYSASLSGVGGTAPYTLTATGLPPGLSMTKAGQISGTPTTKGTYTINATVTDKSGATATNPVSIAISVPALTLAGPVRDASLGVAVTGGLTVTGGTPPYACAVIDGALPAGIRLAPDCTFTGTPTELGRSAFTAQVTDKEGSTASQSFTMTVVPAAIVIATATLPDGTVGTAYSQNLSATGGTGALTWSGGGGLPSGITLDSGGKLSGTTLTPGTFTFTATAEDSSGASASKTLTVKFVLPSAPSITFGGLGTTAPPATQPALQFMMGSPYPIEISGTLTLTFQGDDGSDDPSVQFSSGGRTLSFTVPANSTTPVFSMPAAALATGTTAGVITITAHFQAAGQDITPDPTPTQIIRIAAGAPVLTDAKATRSGNTITIVVTGFVTSKQMTSATFTFNPASGASFQTTALTVQPDALFSSYFGGAASAGFGSQFKFTQTFSVSGDPNAIASVSVVFANSNGSSQSMTTNIQ